MAVSIWARWKGQTAEEGAAQEAHSLAWTETGAVGHLDEDCLGYGQPLRYLCFEAFEAPRTVAFPAKTLAERLPAALEQVAKIERGVYSASDDQIERITANFRRFVAFCERKERETGEPVTLEVWDAD